MEVSTVSTTAIQMHVEHDPTGYPCFYIHGLSGDQKHDEAKLAEYVRLFEAAPELLAALREIVPALNTARMLMDSKEARDLAGELVEKGRAAIAKAEGR